MRPLSLFRQEKRENFFFSFSFSFVFSFSFSFSLGGVWGRSLEFGRFMQLFAVFLSRH